MSMESGSIETSGGVTISSGEPKDPTDGDLWKRPASTVVRVYDDGRWSPVSYNSEIFTGVF
jgi:hypothetical protein